MGDLIRHPTTLAKWLLHFVPRSLQGYGIEYPTCRLVLEVLALLTGVLLLTRLTTVHTLLPESAYFSPVLLTSMVAQINPLIWIVLTVFVLLLWRCGDLWVRWASIPYGISLKIFVLLLAGALVWVVLSIPTNHYFSQAYLVDRSLVVMIFGLLLQRPIWLLPFLLVVTPLLWQLGAPELGGSIFAHKLQLLYPLTAVTAAFFYFAALGRWPARALIVVLITMVGAAYWEAALAKYSLGWFLNNELHLMLPAARNHGWFISIAPEVIVRFSEAISLFEKPIQGLVLLAEAAVLVLLFNRRFSIFVFVALSVFHLGVFAYYGFFFWTWIVVNLALVGLLYKLPNKFFGYKSFLLGVPLILFGSYWSHAPSLGWLDTRLSYVYQLDAVTDDGRQYALSPTYFGAYADVFTMSSFSYLSPNAVLTAPYGVTVDQQLAGRLQRPLSASQLSELEQARERVSRPIMVAAFTRFVGTYVAAKQGTDASPAWLDWLRAPRQFWGERELPHLPDGAVVKGVVVRQVVQLAVSDGRQVLRDRVILTIPVHDQVSP